MSPVQVTVQDAQIHAKWDSFLQDYCHAEIKTAALEWPDTRSFVVPFNDLQLRSPDLADHVLDRPAHALRIGMEALNKVEVTVDPRPRLRLRVGGVPLDQLVAIRAMRTDHIGRLVIVEGLVRKATEAMPRAQEAAFECKVCTTRAHVLQEDEHLQEPPLCETCEKQQPWRLLEEECRWVDHQKVELQEAPETLRGGQQAESLVVHLTEDLVHKVSPGDRVRITGIVVPQAKRDGQRRRVDFNRVLNAVSIDHLEHSFEEIHLTPEDEAAAAALAADPECMRRLVARIAPSIRGHDDLKQALLMTLVGAPGHREGGKWTRGDVHVLVVGDAGIAKTHLLKRLVSLSPRGIYTIGQTTSGVGLTATTVMDDFGGKGVWTVEAGAFPSAHRGILCIDEISNLAVEELNSLLEPMESQEVSITKAAKARLRSECGVAAAANPSGGYFDNNDPPYKQIELPVPLLSRFDLVFCVRDRPTKDGDEAVARRIVDQHNGTSATAEEAGNLSEDQLRRFVAVAKRVEPVITEAAARAVARIHARIRAETAAQGVPLPHRFANSLCRIAQAYARCHLRPKVLVGDVEAAWALLEQSLRSRGAVDANGRLDVQILATGTSRDQQSRLGHVHALVQRLARASPKRWCRDIDVVDELVADGWDPPQAQSDIETLLRNKQLYRKHGAGTLAALVE